MQQILVVDATEEIQQLSAALSQAGYGVQFAELQHAPDVAAANPADAALFSLMGRFDATAMRAALRSPQLSHGVATLALVRSDQLATFDYAAGFDDFIVYPALSEELLARVARALWLKSGKHDDQTLRAGDLQIDLQNYKVFLGGKPLDLAYKEYELLRFLASNPDKVFTREALLNRVWGYDFYGGSRTVDVHVRRLRSKIEDRTHTFIETVRNVGYRFHIG